MKINNGDQVKVFEWEWTVVSVRDIDINHFEAERVDPREGVVRGYFTPEMVEHEIA